MKDDFILEDTETTKRLKEICLSSSYSCTGEIRRLLSMEVLHNLVKKIPKGNVKLCGNILFGRDKISGEEKFIENLDDYIGYVKDHYHIQHNELTCVLEETLKSKYSKILFNMKDIHKKDNYIQFHDSFRKMFLFNLYDNIRFYSKFSDSRSFTNILLDEIKEYNFYKPEDAIKLEKLFIKIINNRKDNLFNSFVHHSEVREDQYNFFANQIEWLIGDYYKEGSYDFDLMHDDHYIDLFNNDILLFNVISKSKDEIVVRFGIKNKNFKGDKIVRFGKNELDIFLEKLVSKDHTKKYKLDMQLVDATLSFEFWTDYHHNFLDIAFQYSNTGDKFIVDLEPDDMHNLYKMIKKQV